MSEHREGYLFGRKCEGRASAPDDLRVDELKQLAARYGLSSAGTKDILCGRIREHLLSQAVSSEPQMDASKNVAKRVLSKIILKKKPASPPDTEQKELPKKVTKRKLILIKKPSSQSPVKAIKKSPTQPLSPISKSPLKTSPKVIENIVSREMKLITDDYRKKVNLTPEEVDYFISVLELHEDTVKLSDIVNEYLEEHRIVDPAQITRYKYSLFVDELAQKFCRCIDKVSEYTPEYSIPICRKGVINNRGLAIHNFRCRNKEEEWDPRFLPAKNDDEILGIHPAFALYNGAAADDTKINNLKKWKTLKMVDRDVWYNKL